MQQFFFYAKEGYIIQNLCEYDDEKAKNSRLSLYFDINIHCT
jgi:hypothetical protein